MGSTQINLTVHFTVNVLGDATLFTASILRLATMLPAQSSLMRLTLWVAKEAVTVSTRQAGESSLSYSSKWMVSRPLCVCVCVRACGVSTLHVCEKYYVRANFYSYEYG